MEYLEQSLDEYLHGFKDGKGRDDALIDVSIQMLQAI